MNAFLKNTISTVLGIVPDRPYLKIMYRVYTGKNLDLDAPESFNEKLQWLKLNDRKPEYTDMVDKYEVRKFIESRIGEGHLIPLLGIWNDPEEIDFDSLPDKFVLKCTHDCEGLAICRDKASFDRDAAKKKLKMALGRNFFYQGREWPYKNVKPRIICEQYMEDDGQEQLTDYKVFNFNGEPKMIQLDYDRFTGHKRQFFDTEWNRMDVSFHFPSDNKVIEKPAQLDEMLSLAKTLSKGFPQLRTDFYIVGGKIYVGEMTFFHGTGMGRWTPDSFDKTLGSWLDLSEISKGKIK